MNSDKAIVIFAKAPQPGKVKTRLCQSPVPQLGRLTPEASAKLYQAFLEDYGARFQNPPRGAKALFCLRPNKEERSIEVTENLDSLIEPCHEGRRAKDIGEAMAFTIRHFLARGFSKVIILGSDLPHIGFDVLEAAFDLLDEAPLVLGNDGGGCYLVAAAAPPLALEGGHITWSQGEDFEAIKQRQHSLGLQYLCLPHIARDIDRPADLERLLKRLAVESTLRATIPHTSQCLRALGAAIPENETRMKLTVNGESLETTQNKLGQLLDSLSIKRAGCAVEINEEIVPRARIDERSLQEGDVIEIVRLVGGG